MKLITRDELRRKMERGDEFKLVMTLPALAYSAKHIPRSCCFETVGEALARLDPAEEIIVYCADVHCAASIYAYRLLERAGYSRVRRYAGGVGDWEEAGYPLESGPPGPIADRALDERSRRQRPTPQMQGLTRTTRPWRVCV
jgi:rhodanese-related sulfurtransferase